MMKILKICALTLAALFAISGQSSGQTFDLQLAQVLNNGVNFDVAVRIKANGSAFNMGSSNLVFDYTGGISTPTLLSFTNFSGGGFYDTITVTTPAAGRVSVNINYLGPANLGTAVPTSYADVATIRFNTTNPTGSAGLTWRLTAPSRVVVYKDDQTNEVSGGTFNNLAVGSLPIQLSSFTATYITGNQVTLRWTTVSETNSYGFEVQKSLGAGGPYSTIPGSFQAGQGTTTQPHNYSYTDANATAGDWYYRLKQSDLDGTLHFSDAIKPSGVNSVNGKQLPTVFSLDQNYPNPFNPSTQIEFAMPKESRVRLEVYNMLGQKIATLVDEVKTAGYHAVRFDATGLASGLYFYKLSTNEVSFLKKMMLLK